MADETTETPTPVRKGWPKGKSRTRAAAPTEEVKAKPPTVDIRVIERRLRDPYAYEEDSIRLKSGGEPMYLRWFNDDPSMNGRAYKAVHYLGFVYVPRN